MKRARIPGLGTRLRELRHARGWTQAEAATRAKIHPLQIAFYEQGRREPNLSSLRKLCLLYKVPADHIIGIRQ